MHRSIFLQPMKTRQNHTGQDISYFPYKIDHIFLSRRHSHRRLGFYLGAAAGVAVFAAGIIAFVVVVTTRQYFIIS